MFRVSTVNLSADATRAHQALGTTELGDVPRDELLALLARFRDAEETQATEVEPHLVVVSRAGRFIVRTDQKKLFLYDARDREQPYAELTPEGIVTQLEREPTAATPWPPAEPAIDVPTAHRASPHRGIAATILIAGLALNGYTLYSVFYTESVNVMPAVTLLTEPAEVTTRIQAVTGTYATGDKPGDRTITIKPDGRVEFAETGTTNALLNNHDTYKIGKRGDRYCLATTESGVIEVFDLDTVIYYRDTYKRK